jgi:single-strand DNA-binding protein
MANFNLNKVILGGRLTSDPELKQTQSGIPVCSFSVAVNRRGSGESEQKVDFINCQAWRQTAEFLSRYFRKGSSVCIIGSIQTRSWTDQNNQKRTAVEVVAEEVNFVDSKGEISSSVATNEAPKASVPASYIPDAYKPNSASQTSFELVEQSDDLPF